MGRGVMVMFAVLAVGCGAPTEDPSPTCSDELVEYDEIMQGLDRTCATPDDCVMVGGIDSCECVFVMPGGAVNRTAYEPVATRLAELEADVRRATSSSYDSEASGETCCICDAGLMSATCEDQQCVVVFGSEWSPSRRM
jgi:hypothetical protein